MPLLMGYNPVGGVNVQGTDKVQKLQSIGIASNFYHSLILERESKAAFNL